ncbi:MAG: RseA family anti-sigma factor [Gammaproteobacteria bacterium]
MTAGPDQTPLIDEQLSAWLDDELPAAELQLLASRLERSPEHRARLARYGLIGSTLRGAPAGARSPGVAALQVSVRVGAVLDESSVVTAPAIGRPARSTLRYAIAAGVGLVAVALVPLLRPAGPPAADPNAVIAGTAVVPPASRPSSRVVDRVGGSEQPSLSTRRLTNYLVYHGEYSGMLSAKLTDSHIINNRSYAVAVQTSDRPSDP